MRVGWLSHHEEGYTALEHLLDCGYRIACVITLSDDILCTRSGAADYRTLCTSRSLPLYTVRNINDEAAQALLRQLNLDVLLVIGWSQILREQTLRLVKIGMVGAHASLLPRNRGSAPINWAIIRGEKETGNSLIWLSEAVDAGDIIDQRRFEITPFDTCASLYKKVAKSNGEMLSMFLDSLAHGCEQRIAQTVLDQAVLPRRRPEDGLIDWSRPARQVYDLIRALTRPYPGAFSFIDDRLWYIWHAALLPDVLKTDQVAGTALGSVFSPELAACGQVVACGDGSAVVLLELENESGTVLKGAELSNAPFRSKHWSNGTQR